MSIAERITTATVDPAASEIGKIITIIINVTTKSGGNISKIWIFDDSFFNVIKSKQPDAISHNLVGIKKYAADWFVGYK